MRFRMRDAGLAANSIKSYTRTLKSFLSWCNEAGITQLNIPLYKAFRGLAPTVPSLPSARGYCSSSLPVWGLVYHFLGGLSRGAGAGHRVLNKYRYLGKSHFFVSGKSAGSGPNSGGTTDMFFVRPEPVGLGRFSAPSANAILSRRSRSA